jgi:hypothetical protein
MRGLRLAVRRHWMATRAGRAGRVAASPRGASATGLHHSAPAWWADGLVSPPQDSGGALQLVVPGGASVARPASVAAGTGRRGYLDDKRLKSKACRYA